MIIKKNIYIGILAHVDAGKTTVTENLLYHGGAIEKIGSVDDGNTQTDNMELEKKRGITIKASAISYNYNDVKINILDTPGHMDFISEVERSLSVLDGAILVVSAVEGVQTQTKLIFKSLAKLNIPTIIFVNKIDRVGADYDRVYDEICTELSDRAVKMQLCESIASKEALVIDDINNEKIQNNIIDIVSQIDEEVLEKYLENGYINKQELVEKLVKYTKKCEAYPVFTGSAALDIGTKVLNDKIIEYLPLNQADETELSGVVFKIERNGSYLKRAYFRLFSGKIDVRDTICINNETYEKVKNMSCLENGHIIPGQTVRSGDIGIIYGMEFLRIGDIIGKKNDKLKYLSLAKPTIKTRVALTDGEDNHKLYAALTNFADEDPLLELETDITNGDIYVKLFGEVQKEILKDILKNNYKLDIEFSKTQTIYKETICGTGTAIMVMWQKPNVYSATVELRVEPIDINEGVVYESEVTTGFLTKSFQNAIEEAVFEACKHGLYGWELTGIKVTLVHTEFDSVSSTPADFRNVTPMVLMEAIDMAKTKLLEPINDFELQIPEYAISKAISELKIHKAEFDAPNIKGNGYIIAGTIAAEKSVEISKKIASYTGGKGTFITQYKGYVETKFDESKINKCNFINALNKKEYIMYKSKR